MTHCRSTIPANHGSRVQFRQRLTVAGNENENFESYPNQFLQPPVAGVLSRGGGTGESGLNADDSCHISPWKGGGAVPT